jgi:hypothetical protein
MIKQDAITQPSAEVSEIAEQSESLASPSPFLVGSIFYLAVGIALAIFVLIPSGLTARMDFRAMYVGGYLLRTDPGHLYDLARQKELEDSLFGAHFGVLPFAHLAPEALLFLPFSLLSFRTAYLCIVIFNIVMAGACFFAARDAFSHIFAPWQPRPGFAIFVYIPVFFAIVHGQDSLLLLLFYCLAWRELSRGRTFSAGAFAAVVLLKPHIGLIAGLLLALRLGWRFLTGFAAAAVALALAFYALVGKVGINAYLALLRRISLLEGQSDVAQRAIGVYPPTMPNLRGLVYATFGRHLSSVHAFYCVAILSLLIIIWVAYSVRRLPQREAFILAVFAAFLLSYNIQRSELAILLLPILLLRSLPGRSISWIVAALFVLPIVCLLIQPGNEMTLLFLVSIPTLAAMVLVVWRSRTPNDLQAVTPC